MLAAIVARVGPCRPERTPKRSAFAALVEAIVYQQLAGAAAATIHGRVRALFERRAPRAQDILGTTDRQLRAAGLSRQKTASLRDLAARVQDGLPLRQLHRLDDEGVVLALSAVKGIGRWTAEMFLIFQLGRLDVLPVDDYGVRKAMQKAWHRRELPKADWMRSKAEPWRPYRSIACWYLWRSLEFPGS